MADQGRHLLLQQACPECKNGEGLEGVGAVIVKAPFVECWRCDGHGLVEPFDTLESKIVVHNGETSGS